MINLLPDERKSDIRAARMNVMLLQYNLIMVATVVILGGFCLGFYIFVNNSDQISLTTTETNRQKTVALNPTKLAADDYRKNLVTAKQILANGVRYTEVINAITKILPPGVVLDKISLSVNNFGQQTDFSAHATSYKVAEELKSKFQDSKTFTNVFFRTLGYASGTDKLSLEYPIGISMSVKLNSVGTFYEK